MAKAPDFSTKTVLALAQRVNYNCSRAGCGKPTAGPNLNPHKATISGQAAHINGAKRTAARFVIDMTDVERADISNGIWLCMPCHKKIDTDWRKFPADEIRNWKNLAEAHAENSQDQSPGIERAAANNEFAELPALWCHETTNDQTYVRRHGKVRQLNGWYNDSGIRTISIAGIGGAGKTSLVGSWLKEDNHHLFRSVEGVLYWSFYVEQNIDTFLRELMAFLETLRPIEFDGSQDDPLNAFMMLRDKPPLLLILDGLEVLQHALSEGRSYGQFIDAKLRDFILYLTHLKEPWLCVTTSRFPLTDLKGVSCARELQLKRLEKREAEEVLYANGVLGVEVERLEISEFLEYHPLTLRLFAASLPESLVHTPRTHLKSIFGDKLNYSSFQFKLEKLLKFYRSVLDSRQRSLIHALSLFRTQVPVSTVIALSQVLVDSSKKSSGSSTEVELARLHTSGILIRDVIGEQTYYACHPIIRDFFRADLFAGGRTASQQAIGLMTERPDELGLHGVTDLEPIVLAIECLAELGDFPSALELYVKRLEKGDAFLKRGLAKEGKRMFEAFVRYENTAKEMSALEQIQREAFRQQDLGSFLVGASEFDIELGEYADALIVLERASNKVYGSRRSDPLRNMSRVEYNLGHYEESIDYAERAARAIGGSIYSGTNAYKGALSLYCLIRSLTITGERKAAEVALAELHDVLKAVDLVDVLILEHLAGLRISIAKRGHRDCEALARRCNNQIPYMTKEHLAMEAQLVAAHGYILSNKPAKAIKFVDQVYDNAISKSLPARMCRAIVLKEYAKYRLNITPSPARLLDAARMAGAGGMSGIQAEALWCAHLTTSDKSEATQYRDEAERLADLSGYTTLRVSHPKRK